MSKWKQGEKGNFRDIVFLVPWNESNGIPHDRNMWIDCNNSENARLISAAPDLLDALSAIVHSAEDGCAAINTRFLINAKAAIAKATGKTQ